MPEIGKIKHVQQGSIHNVKRAQQGSIHIVRVNTAVLEWAGATYDGAYEVTPSGQEQTIPTYGRILTDNHDHTERNIQRECTG